LNLSEYISRLGQQVREYFSYISYIIRPTKRTNYGTKRKGSSKFVIVAPHAGGDDIRTKDLAEAIARHLNASIVVNDTYIKETNSRASTNPHLVSDFNKLSWNRTAKRYMWDNRHPHMKEFYEHISELAKHAKSYGNGRSIIVYIHSLKDYPDLVGIDIGFGAKMHQGLLKGTRRSGNIPPHPNKGKNTGVLRADREDMLNLQKNLEQRINELNPQLRVTHGEHYAAWDSRDGIQWHRGSEDETSFQLEFSAYLRRPENLESVAKMISDSLKEVYKN
jgi:hypothetical protein